MIMLKEVHAPFFAFFLAGPTAPPLTTTVCLSLPDLPLRLSSVCVADKACLAEGRVSGTNEDGKKNKRGPLPE
jgi:hypothetical protein